MAAPRGGSTEISPKQDRHLHRKPRAPRLVRILQSDRQAQARGGGAADRRQAFHRSYGGGNRGRSVPASERHQLLRGCRSHAQGTFFDRQPDLLPEVTLAQHSIDVLIIGAGAAGLMCAIEAGKRGRRVVVLEHNVQIGRKILISGGGRCNFTNVHTKADNFLSANRHFAKSALARYTPRDFITMVERHGIAYHEKTMGQFLCDGSAEPDCRSCRRPSARRPECGSRRDARSDR